MIRRPPRSPLFPYTPLSQSNVVTGQLMRDDGSTEPPFVIGNGLDPDVATDGKQWLVVWQTNEIVPQIANTIVTSDLDVVSPPNTLLVRSDNMQTLPVVASRGSDYLVAWNEANRSEERRVGKE